MNVRRARWLLVAAFAISLLVHFVLAAWVRPIAPPHDEVVAVALQAKPHVLRIMRAPRPTVPPRTPPPATPSPRPVSSPPPRTREKPIVSAVPATHASTPSAPARIARATLRPVPHVAPTPTRCENATLPATLAATPDPPDIPIGARSQGTSGTTSVVVKLSATGAVLDTAISGSSGNGSLDLVALQMAQSATYTPPRINCKAAPGTYTFTAKFVAW